MDEDLPKAVVHLMCERGHQAVSVLDQKMGGWKDPQIWAAVQSEGRFLVTADKGLADARTHPPGSHAGVLLLRPDQDGVQPLMELMKGVLQQADLTSLSGTITVATPRGIRIRRR